MEIHVLQTSPTHREAYEAVAKSPARALQHHGTAAEMQNSAEASGERVLVDTHRLLKLLNQQRCRTRGCPATITTTKITPGGGLVWEVVCMCATCKDVSHFLNIDDST